MKKTDPSGYERDMTAFWGTIIFVIILALAIWLFGAGGSGIGDQCQAAPQQDYQNQTGC